jgi:hypothetical protein
MYKAAWFIITFLAISNACAQLRVNVEMVFGNEPLVLNGKKYVNQHGDTLTIETFKFYLSNFSVHAKGKWSQVEESCFLVDAENNESRQFDLNVSNFTIDSVRFFIGVDSLKNVSGALAGALDPSRGMFWAWNTGYINAKLEGKSNACKTLHHTYEFHVGGFLSPYNACRQVSLKTNGQQSLVLIADVARWFNGVKLSELNSVVIPSKNALTIADNYKNMFSAR